MTEVFGREDVLAAALETVRGQDPPLAVLLEGAPGIGKTIVLDAIVDGARAAGLLVLETRPSEAEARIPMLGLHDLLSPVVDELLARLPAPQRTSLEIALGIADAGAPDGGDAGRLAVAITNGLRALALTQRVLIVADDVQWLDASSASLLATALRRLRAADIRVIATRRTASGGGRGRELSLAKVYGDELRRIELAPLSVGALHRVIGSRLGLSLARPTLVRLHAASGGNPLYALELARLLGSDAPTPERLDASVPEDLATLLGRRISRLPAPVRLVVLVVAMTNRPTTGVLAAAAQLSIEEVDAALHAAIDAGLVVADGTGIRVAHPLIGAAARVRAPAGTRRNLHRRLAAIVADPDEAVVHRALAAAAPDEGVAEALEVAARSALSRGASAEAADLLHRAVRLTPPDRDEARIRRRVALAEAFLVTGDTDRAARELGSLQLASIEDARTRIEAVLHLGVIQWMTGDVTEAIELHEAALRATPDPATQARLHLRLAWLYERDQRRSHDHALAALALLDPATHPSDFAFALLNRAAAELALGEQADHDAIARGAALQERSGAWDVSTIPVNWALWMDDWDRARTLIDQGISLAEERADETGIGHLLGYRAEVEAWSGNLALALEYADAAAQRAESTGQQTYVSSALGRRAQVLAAAGALDRAEADGNLALSIGERQASPTLVARALSALGSVARQRDDPREVDRLLTRASAETAATGDLGEPAHRYHGDHLDALVALGELDRARELVGRLDRRGQLGPRPIATAIAERGRAAIALAEGRIEDAVAHGARAIEQHRLAVEPLEAARTQLLVAQIHRRAGRRKAAEALLREATSTFGAIGAIGWAARARDTLTRLGLQPGDSTALTPSEERIARLAAAGLRNREIASRLFISPKTVEASLARAYDKLGVRSRMQLALALPARVAEEITAET